MAEDWQNNLEHTWNILETYLLTLCLVLFSVLSYSVTGGGYDPPSGSPQCATLHICSASEYWQSGVQISASLSSSK